MRNPIILVALACCLLIASPASAQKWIPMMQDPSVNFYDVQKEFDQDRERTEGKDKTLSEGKEVSKENGEEDSFGQYWSWADYMEPRAYPSGHQLEPSFVSNEFNKYIAHFSKSPSVLADHGSWSLVGPVYQGCAGRVNCVRFDPADTNIIYAGAASGGLWKSTDRGVMWSTRTDNLESLVINDFTFDPTNAGIQYLATAAALLKSTDGGTSWSATGLEGGGCSKVIVNPSNSSVILAFAAGNIWRSADGAESFTKVAAGTLFNSLKFNPANPNIIYAADWQKFYRSTDGGQTFSVITAGLPSAATINLQIGTTPADPNYVYVLASDLNTSGYYGLYLSTDAGLTFTQQSNSPNIVGSQGWFALSIVVSPVNRAEVIVGGLNVWRSTDAGVNWTQISSWYVPAMTGEVHVDIHDLQFNHATLYAGTDGGVFSTLNSGTSWSNLCKGLQVIQPYSVGISQITPGLVMLGTQDNGTTTLNGASWKTNIGGDGSVCFIDWSNDTFRYGSVPTGRLAGSTDGGVTFNYVDADITETTNKLVLPWFQDPSSPKTLYAGYTNVWRTTDRCTTWEKISSFGGGISALAVCASNNNCLCAATDSRKVYRTVDGGANWTDITGSLPMAAASVSDLAIKNSDPNKIWVVFSGTSSGDKVYVTSDGGTTWKNFSGTLPNLPANCIVYQRNSPDGLYLGMDIGVYYRDSLANDWVLFNSSLPNSSVRQLKIQYGSGKLCADLYGRGVWESDLNNFANPSPVALFTSDVTVICVAGKSVSFTDASSYSPSTWLWNFGDGSTSTQQNPTHTFSANGTYTVTLEVNNANGSDSLTKTNYITISIPPYPVTTDDTVFGAVAADLKATPTSPLDSLEWYDASVAGNLVHVGTSYSPTVAATTTYYVAEVAHSPVQVTGAPDSTIGSGGFLAADDGRSPLTFDVYRTATLNAVTVYSDSAGSRTILLTDLAGNVLQGDTVNIPKGQSRVVLNFKLAPGTGYHLKISGLTHLYRNLTGAYFPMTLPGVLSILGDGGPSSWYFYFYNWEVQPDDCVSERATATVTVHSATVASTYSFVTSKITIYPDPTRQNAIVSYSLSEKAEVSIAVYDLVGQQILTKDLGNEDPGTRQYKIDTGSLGAGVYYMRLTANGSTAMCKLVVE